MSSPKPDDIRTEAGQALFHRPLIHTTYCAVKHGKAYRDCICGVTEAILAIENEAYNSGVLDQKLSLEAHADTARPSSVCQRCGHGLTPVEGDPDFDATAIDYRLGSPQLDPRPDTARPVEPQAGGFLVPTRLLRTEWPRGPGLEAGDKRFDEVFESIKSEGIREPLSIHPDWRVIDGAHRLYSALDLGIEFVPVRVWTGREYLP